MKRNPIWIGILLGLFTSLLVIFVMFIGMNLAGLPFAPFNLFDFMARVLPGGMITFGIDMMVSIIAALKTGSTSASAKLAEQSLAIIQFIIIGGLFGGVVAALRNRKTTSSLPLLGAALGLILSIPFIYVKSYLGFSPVGTFASVIWLAIVFAVWGLLLAWLLLSVIEARSAAPSSSITRKEALYLGGTALLSLIAGAVGLRFLFGGESEPQQATSPAPATPESGNTSGPAESPSEQVLAQRIQPAPGTRPEITPNPDFYRIDINTLPPSIDASQWKLELSGLVDHPMTLTLDDIRSRPADSEYITLSCISNYIGGDLISTTLFTGIRLKDLLEEAGMQAGAKELHIESVDGFYESVVMEDMMDERTLLVFEMNGEPLPIAHGFPLRIYIANHYGMKQPKWIERMEVIGNEGNGYWVDRGWSKTAFVQTTSVIDNVSVEHTNGDTIHMGGIAYSGDRGISKVEVQIDDSPWMEAELRIPPLSPLTWVQWRYDGPAQTSEHTARVRTYDGDGNEQILTPSDPHPNGATGVDSFTFSV
jgi:DMSO/TMAO reductase YedYZ molybdopterin-dependent catalytic subunit